LSATAEDARQQAADGHAPLRSHAWWGRSNRSAPVRRSALVPTWVRALACYTLLATLTIGWHAISAPSRVCACVGSQDPAAYMWALAWWPHAILHGLNPFVSHVLWFPTGVNIARAAMIPTAAIAMAPVTALVGPLASYNIVSIASPALAAFTAYLLCRRVVRRELPAFAGGYLFGFGAYQFAQLTGHLNLTLVFLIPVIVHVAVRRLDCSLSRRAYVLVLALLLVLQAGLSTELLAETVAFGLFALLCARWIAPAPYRARVLGLLGESVGAGLIALAVASPFFYYALFSGSFPEGAPNLSDVYGLDLLNPFFPTYSTWLGHHDFLALGLSYEMQNVSEADGYLSVPIVVAFLAWALPAWRRHPLARLLLVVAGLTLLAALGSHLHVAGNQTMTLPFDWVRHLPVLDNIVPSRIILFTALAISIGIAAWLAAPPPGALTRWLVVALGALLIFPNLIKPLYGAEPHNPRFFSTRLHRAYLARGESVLVLPFGVHDVSMLWQAETGFYFSMPEGYVSGEVPVPFNSDPTAANLVLDVSVSAPALGSFIRAHHVRHVVVDPSTPGPWPATLRQLGLHGRSTGGVLLYGVPSE
jgi:hypothetical protein